MQEDMLGFIYKQILHVLNVNDFKAGSKSFLKALQRLWNHSVRIFTLDLCEHCLWKASA